MSVNNLNSKILFNKKGIEKIMLLSSTKLVLKKLNAVRTNILSSKVKKVTEEFLPILAFSSKNKVHNAIK